MMTTNDPISDLLTRIRNAKDARHRYVDVPMSKMINEILKTIQGQGFIEGFLPNDSKKQLRVFLKYTEGRQSLIQGLTRVSKPGLRRYIGYQNIPVILRGLGMTILSTPKGVIDGETARKLKVGGELLCHIW